MPKTLLKLRHFILLCTLLSIQDSHSQYIFRESQPPGQLSLHPYAQMANVGQEQIHIEDLIAGRRQLEFEPVGTENRDLGFTTDNYWITFTLDNRTDKEFRYYLETARPITDLARFYTVDASKGYGIQQSGDGIPCAERSYQHRKTIFKVDLPPHSAQTFYLHLKSDGEVINLPMMLHTSQSLMMLTSLEQLTYGFFYGILAIAAIIYLFFFFGLKERTFIYYSLYVVFIGLLQFALDGYFYQLITPGGGWLSDHAVLLIATIAAFFLGRYSQLFLKLKENDRFMYRLFNVTYILLACLFIAILVPGLTPVCYPLTNLFGMLVLTLIVASIIRLKMMKVPVDTFFAIGIFFLIAGFVIFILGNFGQIPASFLTQNSSKFGTGMEVIFLSLSMANLIRIVKNEREEFNRLALARSEEMNEMKSYFLSNISHELRTPLNAILTLSTEMAKAATDEKARHDNQIIKYSAHSLLSSVNDILDFSKIEKGELVLEPVQFEPVRVLEHIKNNAVIRAKDQQLQFEYEKTGDIPGMLFGDVTRLAQIVNNILSNALKFTPEGKVAFRLDGQRLPKDRCRLTLTISDTGVGIPKEKLHNIYESFTQDNINNKRKFGGLGLGLYIVRNLVDMQKGTIKIDSKPGEGTTCKVVLDYDIVHAEKAVEVPTETAAFDLDGKHILVVEDNAINQMVIKMILKKWRNTTADYALNGQEALDKLQAADFDIVLMDLQMPVMDGYEATIAIRKGEAGESNTHIPIIAVTADVMETTKITVREIGMDDYLSKPLKAETLYEAVKRLV